MRTQSKSANTSLAHTHSFKGHWLQAPCSGGMATIPLLRNFGKRKRKHSFLSLNTKASGVWWGMPAQEMEATLLFLKDSNLRRKHYSTLIVFHIYSKHLLQKFVFKIGFFSIKFGEKSRIILYF